MCLIEPSKIAEPRMTRNSRQDPHQRDRYMEARGGNKPRNPAMEGRIMDYQRSFSAGNGKKLIASYFSLESLLLLVCLTVSLLILPLILPPLPPPPLLLLLIPIGLLGVLMFLAFMPSNIRDLTYAYT